MNNPQIKKYLNKLEKKLDIIYIDQAPALPKSLKFFLVKFLPWLVILALGALIYYLKLILGQKPALFFSIMLFDEKIIVLIYVLSIGIFLLLSFMGLFSQKKKSWYYLYLVGIITAIYSLATLNLAGIIFIALIWFYPLFQVKEYYSNA